MVGAAALAGAPRALADTPPPAAVRRELSFAIWRQGSQIGRHHVSFEGEGPDFTAAVEAELIVKIGPIPVFHYHHQSRETWRAGRFDSLESHTTSNGKRETVIARANEQGVAITPASGAPVQAAPNSHPLTHWNAAVLQGPLFNPQTGAVLHERVARSAEPLRLPDGRSVPTTRYALKGEAEITDWYDPSGVWLALRGKAQDGSYIDYRREG
jgi:hypothetical protein